MDKTNYYIQGNYIKKIPVTQEQIDDSVNFPLIINGKPFINEPMKITKEDMEKHTNFMKNLGSWIWTKIAEIANTSD